jgi:hypothetical protein
MREPVFNEIPAALERDAQIFINQAGQSGGMRDHVSQGEEDDQQNLAEHICQIH